MATQDANHVFVVKGQWRQPQLDLVMPYARGDAFELGLSVRARVARDWHCTIVHPGNAHLGVSPRVRVRGKEREVCFRSLFMFTINGRFRQLVLALVEWRWFDRFILLLICLNSIFMAAYDQRGSEVGFNAFVNIVTEPIFLALFTLEMTLKVIAWGLLLDTRTYLRDPWNWLDFIVVGAGWVQFAGLANGGLNCLRLFRILRPLRSLNTVPQMKVLVNTVLSCVSRLFNVVEVTLVVWIIFGCVGTTLFGGVLYRGCHTTEQPALIPDPQRNGSHCWSWPLVLSCDGSCSKVAFTDEESCVAAGAQWAQVNCRYGRVCGGNYMCKDIGGFCGGSEDDRDAEFRPRFPDLADLSQEPLDGALACTATSGTNCAGRKGFPWCEDSVPGYVRDSAPFINFDNLGTALLTIFQSMTMEGWTLVMYDMQDGYGFWVGSLYFIALIPVTSFLLLNVALAVVDEAREDGLAATVNPEPPLLQRVGSANFETTQSTSGTNFRNRSPNGTALGGDGDEGHLDRDLVQSEARATKWDTHDAQEPEANTEVMQSPTKPNIWWDRRVVRILRAVAFSAIFTNLIMFFIAGNVVCMMLESYPPILVLQQPLATAEVVFIAVFVAEMIIMLGAVGPKSYILNPVTCFDGMIVLVSLTQKIISMTQDGAITGGSAFTALRTLRLLRVLNKLVARFRPFRVLLQAMVATAMSLRYWFSLFVLVLYIFTLMFVDFFAERFHFVDASPTGPLTEDVGQPWCDGIVGNEDCIPYPNFDTFYWGAITVFQMMTVDGWNFILYQGLVAYEGAWRLFVVIMFMFFMLFGEILFLSLFLSMLMAKFQEVQDFIEEQEVAKDMERRRLAQSKAATFRKSVKLRMSFSNIGGWMSREFSDPSTKKPHFFNFLYDGRKPVENGRTVEESFQKVFPAPLDINGHGAEKPSAILHCKEVHSDGEEDCDVLVCAAVVQHPQPQPLQPGGGARLPKGAWLPQKSDAALTEHSTADTEDLVEPIGLGSRWDGEHPGGAMVKPQEEAQFTTPRIQRWPHGYALFVFSDSNVIRRAANWILNSEIRIWKLKVHVFDSIILASILLSTIGMAYDSPLRNPDDTVTRVARGSDIVFSFIFIVEMVVKVVAVGFVWGEHAYMRSRWNWVDGAVVAISVAGLVSGGSGGFLKTLRLLRAFRPLRVISRNPNLKVVVNTMFASLPDLLTLILVTLFFLLMFAIFFLSFLDGRLYQCSYQYQDSPWTEGVRLSVDLGAFAIPLCLGTNATTLACPHGRPLSSRSAKGETFQWIDSSLTCADALKNSYCATYSPDLTVPWRRPTWDTPICLGHCNPAAQAKDPDFWSSRRWLCEAEFQSIQELPSVCEDANSAGYLANMSQEEKRGRTFVAQMQRQLVMPCGGTSLSLSGTVETPPAAAAVSCRTTFCPKNVSASKLRQCKDDCESHPHFCSLACADDTSTPGCVACRSECEAQCQCSDFCTPLIKDAAACHEQGGQWVEQLSQNFNNIASSMLTLFEIMSTEGWENVMWAAGDTTGVYLAPRRNASQWIAAFFVVYMLLSYFFLLNLGVGVIMDKYKALKKSGSVIMITPAQQRWLDSKKNLFSRSLYFLLTDLHKLHPRRKATYKLVSGRYFDNGIMGAILLNTVIMSLKIWPAPTGWWDAALEASDGVFAFVFLVELVLKYYALRRNYWKDVWNRFDCFCVIVSIIGLVMKLIPVMSRFSPVAAIIRIFRVGRLFRFFKGPNKIFMALVLSIPKLANVLGVFMLFLVLFSILGVNLFSTVQLAATYDTHANFSNVVVAFITLFRCVTGEAWNELMHDLDKTPEDYFSQGSWCTPTDLFNPLDRDAWKVLNSKCLIDRPNSCVPFGDYHVSVIYFVIYTLMITYMVLNLVIAVILEGYEDGRPSFETEVIDTCISIWKRYDPDQTMAMPSHMILPFIDEAVATALSAEAFSHVRKRENILGADLGKLTMKYAKLLQDVPITTDGQVMFLSAVKQVLRLVVALREQPTTDFSEGTRLEVVKVMRYEDYQLSVGALGTVRKIVKSGDALVDWDNIGQRFLSAQDFRRVTALPLHKLLQDIDNVDSKVDTKELERLRNIEDAKTKMYVRSTPNGDQQHDLRMIVIVLKMQRNFRQRRAAGGVVPARPLALPASSPPPRTRGGTAQIIAVPQGDFALPGCSDSGPMAAPPASLPLSDRGPAAKAAARGGPAR